MFHMPTASPLRGDIHFSSHDNDVVGECRRGDLMGVGAIVNVCVTAHHHSRSTYTGICAATATMADSVGQYEIIVHRIAPASC